MAQPFTIEPDPNPLDHPPAFLANGGAVGKLLLSLDAASSPLGPPDASTDLPHSLGILTHG
ncbi:hypothetical protein, partial [Pseudomonas aeruginosa]|uniref:hypothetical protein n=1 Tax=Pseudomonas aeruginosa TaxID=287 RepID=UPI003969E091